MKLPVLGTPYMWNHTIFDLLCLAYFAYHNVFKIYPCCSMCQNFTLLFSLNNIYCIIHIFCLSIHLRVGNGEQYCSE